MSDDQKIEGHSGAFFGGPKGSNFNIPSRVSFLHSTGAAYTHNDAKAHRPVCQACVQGTMRQASTDHFRVHRAPAPIPGSQFALDAYTHAERGAGRFKYCDLFTDLTKRCLYPVFTRDQGAQELCDQVSLLINPNQNGGTHLLHQTQSIGSLGSMQKSHIDLVSPPSASEALDTALSPHHLVTSMPME